MSIVAILSDLQSLANPDKAKIFARFFKTGPGQYGEGDKFYGIMTQPLVKLTDRYWQKLDFNDIDQLLQNPYHECRTIAVSSLRREFQKTKDPKFKKQIFDFYLAHTSRLNNWDLVDISAPHIVGNYLLHQPRQILYQLAKSDLLWDRRISIIATYTFIRQGEFADTLEISKILMTDRHDLIHKAVGWMLREIGKKDLPTLIKFLDQFTPQLPRTTLRYAIEKLPEQKRQHYLTL